MLTAAIVFTDVEGFKESRQSFTRHFLPGVDKKFYCCNVREDLADIVSSLSADFIYIVQKSVLCVAAMGRSVLPGIFYDGVVVPGVMLGGKAAVVKDVVHKDVMEGDSRMRVVDAEELPISNITADNNTYKVIISVVSCCRYKSKRDAIRATWKKDLPDDVKCLFYVGSGSCEDSSDLVQLPYADDYNNVPGKQLLFYEWLIANENFEWVFQVDDDTYVAPDRVSMYLNNNMDMIGQMFMDKHMHGGVGYFMHRRLLLSMVNNEHLLKRTGNGDINFSKLAFSVGAKVSNIRLGCIKVKDGSPITNRRYVTTHYVSEEKQAELHSAYKLLTRWDSLPENRIAVVGTFAGEYVRFLKDWYVSVEKYLIPDKKKDYFIVTDTDEEAIHSIIPGARVYKHESKPRSWWLMLQRISLLLTGPDTCLYKLVVYVQASALFTSSQSYEKLAPVGDKNWSNVVTSLDSEEHYALGEKSGAPFLNDFEPIVGRHPWPLGAMTCVKGSYVLQWSSYFIDKMTECVELGIYPEGYDESLLYRMLHCQSSSGQYFDETGVVTLDTY